MVQLILCKLTFIPGHACVLSFYLSVGQSINILVYGHDKFLTDFTSISNITCPCIQSKKHCSKIGYMNHKTLKVEDFFRNNSPR